MTLRQSLLKTFYPLLMMSNKIFGSKHLIIKNTANAKPVTSFHSLKAIDINGTGINFEQFRGKKVLLVNTASDCGYTGQYEDLEKLHRLYKDSLIILAFPANDFKKQEKGSDEEIAQFCKSNYGVTFSLIKKSTVIKSSEQNGIFQWLTNKNKNGWNNQQPAWNFSKYLVNDQGILTYYFAPSISPMSDVIINAIRQS